LVPSEERARAAQREEEEGFFRVVVERGKHGGLLWRDGSQGGQPVRADGVIDDAEGEVDECE